jgi:hypothetical protein
MTSLQRYWPQVSATLQVASPLLWGVLCAAATHQRALTERWAWTALVITFPLLWARGDSIPSPAAWALPVACWLAAVLSARSPRLTLRAAFLLATGVSTAALQLWQVLH